MQFSSIYTIYKSSLSKSQSGAKEDFFLLPLGRDWAIFLKITLTKTSVDCPSEKKVDKYQLGLFVSFLYVQLLLTV